MSDVAVKSSEPIALKGRLNEDWLAVVIGLLVFGLALFSIGGTDLLGWAVNTSVYADITRALAPIAKAYVWLGGVGALLATYVALLVVLSIGVATLGADVKKFAVAFTAVFAIAYASWILGSYAHIAAVTPAEQQKFGIDWSLKLTNEGGYIVALLSGLVIANFLPKFASWLQEAIRPELYIKIAIVILGATVASHRRRPLESCLVSIAARCGRDRRGLSDLLGRYLLRRAQMVRLQPRVVGAAGFRHFDLRRGGGDRDRRRDPGTPCGAGAGVVARGVVEVLILPFLAQTFLWQEPLVAGAWMGLAIKTDGAAVAGGGITESLIMAKAAAEGIRYQPGWILATTTTVKIFIDIFIGVWAFILGYIWTNYIDKGPDKARPIEIWQRFPKFILVFAVSLWLALGSTPEIAKALPAAAGEANVFRVIFFILTFFSIGVLSDFRKLWHRASANWPRSISSACSAS